MSFRAFRLVFFIFIYAASPGWAQTTFPSQGIREANPSCHAFVHGTVHPSPGKVLENATLIIRNGAVEKIGQNLPIPKDAVVHECEGRHIFPGLVDAWSSYGAKKDPGLHSGGREGAPQYSSKAPGPFAWNQAVHPESKLAGQFSPVPNVQSKFRENGFSSLHVVPLDGIFRGLSLVASTGNGKPQELIRDADLATCLSFNKGSSPQEYPSSLMGAIALIRQTLLDAEWYVQAKTAFQQNPSLPAPETNLSLEAWNDQRTNHLPVFFEGGDWQNLLRANQISKEFHLPIILKSIGDEYQRPAAIKEAGIRTVVPINFPKAYQFRDPLEAREIPLSTLREWELSPTNPGILAAQGIPFAITSDGLEKQEDFWPNLRKAIAHGLSPDEALRALTTTPAQFLGMDAQIGTLEPGKRADFFLSYGDPFRETEAAILETWVNGKGYVAKETPPIQPFGLWDFFWGNESYRISIEGSLTKPTAKLIVGNDTLKTEIAFEGWEVRASFSPKNSPETKIALLGFISSGKMEGMGAKNEGAPFNWTGRQVSTQNLKPTAFTPIKLVDLDSLGKMPFPNSGYGWDRLPTQQTFLIKNVTVWSNTSKGKMEGMDVLVSEGKVRKIGKNLEEKGAILVEGTGKHLTPGIIDEHSHIAISRGVNEGTHAVTAEVRIGDVLDCEDVNIYRQLSGGVTAAQLLHGSANPIGGQSAIIKLRWGATPEELKMEDAPGFIKFALGENVKQSNWGDAFRVRYPQTRPGVEQIIRDAFQAAKDYRQQAENFKGKNPQTLPPRKNLQLETLVEILDGKRFITCHSYVQSEITMLMRLAEEMGFKINTFTHILEGYKIADKLLAHGANASTFSDWWAYKFEVIDAIPYNAALMQKLGINVCINSDDVEMARRLNQEAAKAVLYGGVPEEEALKMVTLNPAKALHIDHKVGSIAPGMDADLVLWTAPPLSMYALAEKTFVDGKLLFDRSQDLILRQQIQSERMRILGKMNKTGGEKAPPPSGLPKPENHCESLPWDYNIEGGNSHE